MISLSGVFREHFLDKVIKDEPTAGNSVAWLFLMDSWAEDEAWETLQSLPHPIASWCDVLVEALETGYSPLDDEQ
jgi:hypothetical protein